MTKKSYQEHQSITEAAKSLGYSTYNTEADRRALEKEMHDALDAAGQGPNPEKPLTRKQPETMSPLRKAAAIAIALAAAIGVGNAIKEKLPYDRVFNPAEPVDPLPRDAQLTDFPKDPRQAQITVTQPKETGSKTSE